MANERRMVENLKEELEKSDKDLNYIVAGEMGVGKSHLINEIFGEKVAEESTGPEPVTTKFYRYIRSLILDGKAYTQSLIDTPGFGDTEIETEELAKDICDVYKFCHLMIYCIRATDRLVSGTINNLQKITDLGGPEIWKHTVFVFTQADSLLQAGDKILLDKWQKTLSAKFPSIGNHAKYAVYGTGDRWNDLMFKIGLAVHEKARVPSLLITVASGIVGAGIGGVLGGLVDGPIGVVAGGIVGSGAGAGISECVDVNPGALVGAAAGGAAGGVAAAVGCGVLTVSQITMNAGPNLLPIMANFLLKLSILDSKAVVLDLAGLLNISLSVSEVAFTTSQLAFIGGGITLCAVLLGIAGYYIYKNYCT